MAKRATDTVTGEVAFGLPQGEKSEAEILKIYGERHDTKQSNAHAEALRRTSQYLLGARQDESLQVAWPVLSVNEYGVLQERLLLLSNKALYRARWDFKTKRVTKYSRVELDDITGVTFGNLYQGLAKTKEVAVQIFTKKQDGRTNWPAFYQEEKGQEFYRVYCPLQLTNGSPNTYKTIKEMVECLIFTCLTTDRKVTLSVKKSGIKETIPDIKHCVRDPSTVEQRRESSVDCEEYEQDDEEEEEGHFFSYKDGGGGGGKMVGSQREKDKTRGAKGSGLEKGRVTTTVSARSGGSPRPNETKSQNAADSDGTLLSVNAQNVCFVHQGGAVAYLANTFGAGLWSKRVQN